MTAGLTALVANTLQIVIVGTPFYDIDTVVNRILDSEEGGMGEVEQQRVWGAISCQVFVCLLSFHHLNSPHSCCLDYCASDTIFPCGGDSLCPSSLAGICRWAALCPIAVSSASVPLCPCRICFLLYVLCLLTMLWYIFPTAWHTLYTGWWHFIKVVYLQIMLNHPTKHWYSEKWPSVPLCLT